MKNILFYAGFAGALAVGVIVYIACQPAPEYNYVKRTATGTVVRKYDSLKEWNRATTFVISDANPPLDPALENDYYHGTITTNDREIYYKSQIGDKYDLVFGDQVITRHGMSEIESRAMLNFSQK